MITLKTSGTKKVCELKAVHWWHTNIEQTKKLEGLTALVDTNVGHGG